MSRFAPSLVLLLAVGLDLGLGEPPNALHPVAWIGRLIGRGFRFKAAPRQPAGGAFLAGMGLTLLTLLVTGGAAFTVVLGLGLFGPAALVLGVGLALKPAFAGRALVAAVRRVRAPLAAGRVGEARTALSYLVSRDTSGLDAGLVAAAAVETLAENLTDSLVAPLFYYLLGLAIATLSGLAVELALAIAVGAAWAYRAANTLDAMVGYRGRYEYLGKFAARLDDALNWLPARLAATLLVAAAPLAGANPARALRIAWRDHGRTASPNAGWTMAATAGALAVQLEKVGHYRLGDAVLACDVRAIDRAIGLVTVAASLWLLVAVGVALSLGGGA